MEKEYQSKFTEDLITAAQYLTDIAMERIAKKEKEVLPRKYWNLPKWSKKYRQQIVAANALLKEFKCQDIVAALNSPRGRNIYSLGLKKPIIEIVINTKKVVKVTAPSIDHDADIFDDLSVDDECSDKVVKQTKSLWEELQ